MDSLLIWLRRYLSPVFLALLVASFVLWYIAKLNYSYTTSQTISVKLDEVPFEVQCTFEGLGTNLFGYRLYANKTVHLTRSDIKYRRSREEGHEGKIIIDPQSLQTALSTRFSDIKVVSVDDIPEIDYPKQ